ncbi:MAG: glycosyltransferase [Methylotenera sp.]
MRKEYPKISFLIPSYNHSHYISYTLDSIVADASSLNYEILVIDDGSTDETKSKLESWCERHEEVDIKVTYRENRGLCATLNQLVHQASGDIIRLCASDDGIYQGSSLNIISAFEHSEAQVLIGDAFVVDDQGATVGSSAISLNGGNLLKMQTQAGLKQEIVANWSLPGPCVAMRKSVYGIVGYYSEDLLVEDWDFFLRLAALCQIQFLNTPFSYYRVHAANTCKTLSYERRFRNNCSQLAAGKQRCHLFAGKLRLLLKIECLILRMKIAYLWLKKGFAP